MSLMSKKPIFKTIFDILSQNRSKLLAKINFSTMGSFFKSRKTESNGSSVKMTNFPTKIDVTYRMKDKSSKHSRFQLDGIKLLIAQSNQSDNNLRQTSRRNDLTTQSAVAMASAASVASSVTFILISFLLCVAVDCNGSHRHMKPHMRKDHQHYVPTPPASSGVATPVHSLLRETKLLQDAEYSSKIQKLTLKLSN